MGSVDCVRWFQASSFLSVPKLLPPASSAAAPAAMLLVMMVLFATSPSPPPAEMYAEAKTPQF